MIRASVTGKMLYSAVFIALVFSLPVTTASVDSQEQSSFSLKRATFTSGGASVSGGQYSVSETLGQPTPIGIGASAENTLFAGIYDGNVIPTSTGDMPNAAVHLLHQNYPNPFNPSTTISYTVGKGGPVTVEIYSVNGQRIRILVDEVKEPGIHSVVWDGRNDKDIRVATGIYFCRLQIDSYSTVRKMLLIQ
jgi:hypothetical protein